MSGAADAWVSGAAGTVIVEVSGASGAVVVGVTGAVAVEVVEVVEAGLGESPAGVGVADAGVEGAAASERMALRTLEYHAMTSGSMPAVFTMSSSRSLALFFAATLALRRVS